MKIKKEYGVKADNWKALQDVFDSVTDVLKKDIKKDFLVIKLSNGEEIKFKNREDIKHRNYPAEKNKWFIFFNDLK